QVDQGELEFARVDLDRPGLGGNTDYESYRIAERARQHVAKGFNALTEKCRCWVKSMAGRKRQKLSRESPPAFGRKLDRLGCTLPLLVACEQLLERLHMAADDHQKIVEIMGHAAG